MSSPFPHWSLQLLHGAVLETLPVKAAAEAEAASLTLQHSALAARPEFVSGIMPVR